MNNHRTQASGNRKIPGSPRLPLSLILTLIACAVGIGSALLRRETGFSIALGDALMIEAIVLLGIGWVGYLKKDGIRFWPRKPASTGAAESWKDRVPSVGEAPLTPPPLPGYEGPDSPEYQRLVEAEAALRKRIIGGGRENDGESDRENGEGAAADRRIPSYFRSAALAGSVLLVLGLFFEYIVPGV